MDRKKWKQLLVYGLTLGASRVAVAGCFPLIPGVFTAALLVEINPTLLLIFSLFGMALFLPVQAMAKYGMAVLVTAVAVQLVRWAMKSCRTLVGAVIGGAATLILTIAGELLEIRNRGSLWMGILESIFVGAFVLLATPLLYGFMEQGQARQLRRRVRAPENGQRLNSYAEAFGGLSRLFSQMSHKKDQFAAEEMGRMQQEITARICISCDQCALCWERENSPMYEMFHRLLSSMETLGMPREELQEEFSQYCAYPQVIIEEALGVFERARLNMSWYNRLLENREVIAQQLDAMAYIMEDCAREYVDITREQGKLLAGVRYRLRERGGQVREVHLYEKQNGRLCLQLTLSAKWGSCIAVKDLAKAVSDGMHKTMIPVRDSKTLVGKEETVLTFEEQPLYRTLHGVARIPKDGAQVSGDNFSFLELEGGQSVITLSDGMGSGIRACKESEMVIELIERFLETGFRKETAIQMMNSAMVMQGEDGMFSTVDMAAIDLYTGVCEFYKIGAAATFIKRGDQVQSICAASLPVGIYPQVELERSSVNLKDGDFVILVSDGIMDFLSVPDPEETMKEVIASVQINNPEKLARLLMERVLLFTGGKAPDDMTILAAGIWER